MEQVGLKYLDFLMEICQAMQQTGQLQLYLSIDYLIITLHHPGFSLQQL